MVTMQAFINKCSEVIPEVIQVYSLEENGGLDRKILSSDVQRPGLAISGFLSEFSKKKGLLFGKEEISYLKGLDESSAFKKLEALEWEEIPFVVVSYGLKVPKVLTRVCGAVNVPYFRVNLPTTAVLIKLKHVLDDLFAPEKSFHGTLMDVFGLGVFIQGDSSIGKSETALGLIERKHRLISDDIVIMKKTESGDLIGSGLEITKHLLEIRGIGIINVANLYGAVCVRENMPVDLIVHLEEFQDVKAYDRVGLEERVEEKLGVAIPFYLMPVKPGRDMVLLIETVVMQHRLKLMGLNSAKKFNKKLLEVIEKKQNNSVVKV